jgi:hypothetical protein
MPVSPARLSPAAGNRFRLGAKSYALATCVCLYRHEPGTGLAAEFLVLTPDMRFAHVARMALPQGTEIDFNPAAPAHSAIELDATEARDFLTAHGEGELVEDFADLFNIVQRTSRLVDDALRLNRHAAHDTAH